MHLLVADQWIMKRNNYPLTFDFQLFTFHSPKRTPSRFTGMALQYKNHPCLTIYTNCYD